MSQSRISKIFVSAMLATEMLLGAAPFAAAQTVDSANRNTLIQQNELQILENRLKRQQYQQQQQQFRAQDRQIVPQQRPVVPQVKPSCQLQPSGSSFVRTCR
ncbi:hypothetical protein [Mesorhizobium helmanticense]